MNMKITLYIAPTLDGYIAGPNGEIDWLSVLEQPGEDYGYAQFYDSVDALVMGRKTYELAASVADWPYPSKPSFVFTRQTLTTSHEAITSVSEPVETVMDNLRTQGFQHVWLVGGGELIRSFLDQGLIDEHIISFLPIILGAGIPLFPPPSAERKLKLISSKSYASGLIQAHYKSIATE